MGYKTIYRQVICCYAKHCRSMVKKLGVIYLLFSCHQSIFVKDNPTKFKPDFTLFVTAFPNLCFQRGR